MYSVQKKLFVKSDWQTELSWWRSAALMGFGLNETKCEVS